MATPGSGSLNLFLQGVVPQPLSGSFPLSLTATPSGVNALERGFPLVVTGNPTASGSLNLYCKATNVGSSPGHLNLFVKGSPLTKTLPLFLQNGYQAAPSGFPLYVAGTGYRGALSGSLNLYVQRWPTASLPLFAQAPRLSTSGTMPLFAPGGGSLSGSFPMNLPKVFARQNGSFRIWTSGF